MDHAAERLMATVNLDVSIANQLTGSDSRQKERTAKAFTTAYDREANTITSGTKTLR